MAVKICLDAGHYGRYNRSSAVPEYYESAAMWQLHLLLKQELERRGFEVVTSRTSLDKDRGLTERGMQAEGCALFLSLHSNAAQRESADYVRVYHLVGDHATDADEKSKCIAEKLAPAVYAVMNPREGWEILCDKAATDKNGDGLLNDNRFGVLNGARKVNVPGCIIEHSFHTNKAMAQWLLKQENLLRLARAEADVLEAYFQPAEALKVTYTVSAKLTTDDAQTAKQAAAAMEALGARVETVEQLQRPDIDAIARDVIDGKYGNGQERREKLGDLYAAVQMRVNELLKQGEPL